MEARRVSTDKCSSNLGLGVKSQSSPVIAGSSRNWPKSSLDGDGMHCRDTDLGFLPGNWWVLRPTPKVYAS